MNRSTHDWLLGVLAGLGLAFIWGSAKNWIDEPDPREDERTYEAYRVCIQRSDCKMTADDWIDYYNLEWRLEK